MARLHVLDPSPRATALWATGRHAGMLGLVALIATLAIAPRPALLTLWNVAVPLLPASFFVTPALWRGVCPLSTLNAWGNRFGPARELTPREGALIAAAGLALFHVIVPARHLGLNTDGPLLAVVLLAIGLVALAMGARYASRSAFCNALCPVLPVERLYGQAPLLEVTRGRCDACTVCTPRGCLDLADRKAMRQLLGPTRDGHRWLRTPFGLFATALPGFIVGYGLTPDVPASEWMRVYGATLGGSLVSILILGGAIRLTRSSPSRGVAACAALSGMLYYWITAPVVTRALSLPSTTAAVIRTVALIGIAAWLVRTLSGESGSPAVSRSASVD